MDRLSKLRVLIDQALYQLSLPRSLAHGDYAVVETLHAIAAEVEALLGEGTPSGREAAP